MYIPIEKHSEQWQHSRTPPYRHSSKVANYNRFPLFRGLDCTQAHVNAFGTKQIACNIVVGHFWRVPVGQGSTVYVTCLESWCHCLECFSIGIYVCLQYKLHALKIDAIIWNVFVLVCTFAIQLWKGFFQDSLVPRPHLSRGGKGSGYKTTSRSTLEGCKTKCH